MGYLKGVERVPVKIVMPKLGLTMQEGKIIEWRKKEGDLVEKGEVLFVIETEKITYEVEAPESGVLGKILVNEGETVAVGVVVAYLLVNGETSDSIEQLLVSVAEQEGSHSVTGAIGTIEEKEPEIIAEGQERIKASPVAKKLAEEHKIDLRKVKGTGPGGRITKEDILNILADKEARQIEKEVALSGNGKEEQEAEVIKLSSMRKTIARRMSESFYSAPHIYFTVETDAGEIIQLRKELLPFIERQTGCRLTITDILVKITAKVLKDFPLINASWSENGITVFKKINIGVATAVENGLLVPVIKQADKKTLAELCVERTELVHRAQEGKISMNEITGGTFTITNLGMYNIDFFSAIINPPESAILAVGSIKEKPTYKNGEVTIRPLMYLTLSADHRSVDGAYAARFLKQIKDFVEKPVLALQ